MVKAYVADWKKDEVSQLQDFVKSADVVGLVDVSGIGAKQMLDMRASLRNLGVKLRMSRNRLLKRATCPPESTIRCWPVHAGCVFGSISSFSTSPGAPHVDRVFRSLPSVITIVIS